MADRKGKGQSEREVFETRESMVGFAGFRRCGDEEHKSGLLKVTESLRADGSGYLTLTFILDAEDHTPGIRQLALFSEAELRAGLGPRFEMAMDLPLRGRESGSSYWIEEIDLFFRPLDPFPAPFVAEVLLPMLEKQLQLEFEPLTDWAEHPALEPVRPAPSFWQSLAGWLKLT